MMGFGSFLFRLGWIPVLCAAGGAAYLVVKIRASESFAERCDRYLFGLPLYGKGYRILVCQRFSKTMALLLEGGVSLIDAVILSGRATGSRWISRLCSEQAEEIRHGAKLSEAMKQVPFIADAIAEWMAVGEAAGGLSRMTARAGDRYTRMWESYVARALGMLEPAILIFIGGFVLTIALSVLLPVIQLGKMAGQ
jgi:general secretion pathway protein F